VKRSTAKNNSKIGEWGELCGNVSELFEELLERIEFRGKDSGRSYGGEIQKLLFFEKKVIHVSGFEFLTFKIKIGFQNNVITGIGVRHWKDESESEAQ
jgi:hypothetical protein